MKTFTIIEDFSDMRVDKYVRKELSNLPLSNIYKLLRKKYITVNGKKVKEHYLLQTGDTIEIHVQIEENKESEMKIPRIKPTFQVLFEDDALLIVNKPGGLPVHAGSGLSHNTLINQVLTYLNYAEGYKPSLVHRLDKDTSGCMIFGKTRKAVVAMHTLFREKGIQKVYRALIEGKMHPFEGKIESKLLRQHDGRGDLKVRVSDHGSDALTFYSTEKSWRKVSLLRLRIVTGKTHQIRVHLQSEEHPIIGDTRYGDFEVNRKWKKDTGLKRQFLHAAEISFVHPLTQEKILVKAPFPQDIEKVLTFLKRNG